MPEKESASPESSNPVRGSRDEFDEIQREARAERTAAAIIAASKREAIAKERLKLLKVVHDPLSRPSERDSNVIEGRFGEQVRVVTDQYGNTVPDTDQSTGIVRKIKKVGKALKEALKRESLEKPFSKIIEPKKE